MHRRAVLSLALVLGLSACASSPRPAPIVRPGSTATRPVQPPVQPPVTPPAPVDFALTPARFTDIPGWASADFAPALAAFKRQCSAWKLRTPDAALTGGRYGG